MQTRWPRRAPCAALCPPPSPAYACGVDGTASGRGAADDLDPALLERLSRLGVQLGAEGIEAPPPRPDAAPAPEAGDVEGCVEAGPGRLPIEEAVPGKELRNEGGACYVTAVRRAVSESHGGVRLDAVLELTGAELAGLAGEPRIADFSPASAAYLDTETTGLSGGAGTYAFLVGVGRYREGAFQLRQFFLRDPSEEEAQLRAIARWVEGCDGLVTFNGRSFDKPLLDTRALLHRLPPLLSGRPHLDLLPVARRLWRRRLPGCRLVDLEERLLGFERVDDVPGWLVPGRYLSYQRSGDARPLVGIFRHNALDILSMVSVLARAADLWRRPEQAAEDPRDWLSLARIHDARKDHAAVIAACRSALEDGRPLPEAAVEEARERLGLAARRAEDWDTALAVWTGWIDEGATRLHPFEELAKYWEHRVEPRDLAAALAISRRAEDRLQAGVLRPRRGRRRAARDLAQRIARLERRRAR